ncbi:hypothetical protein TW81_00835 [Vibrio galatheae]|uniref:DUF3080 domain-containing protein n=2 Tax=Vibrio galatheae TaxID=579748 RepID=A0A0F4NQ28_9VIBR|nr:hypothetical protein TW81_00835 [Vibrio galatheae]
MLEKRGFSSEKVVIILSSLLLIACTDTTPSGVFDDYLTRVARVQQAPLVEATANSYIDLARKRELFIEIPPISIGLLDSYQLRQCGLFHLIAEKNSVLGKVEDEFRNYDYQRAVLEGLSRCIQSDAIEQDLKIKLTEIKQQKQAQLHLHQWNLIYASNAMQQQLKGSQWLDSDLGQTATVINQALTTLSLAFENKGKETAQVQEILEKQPFVGKLNYSLAQATHQLNQVTRQLLVHDQQIICAENRDKTKFRYLNNVFEQQYIGRVQPYMAQLDSYYQTLATNLTLFAPQPSIHAYVYPLEQNHLAFRQAIRRHVDYWQSLFKRCGRQVG